MSSKFCKTPEPPYFVVVFSAQRTPGDNGYGRMAERMVELALQQPGCIGVEAARDADGFGITNSYWRDEESLRAWKSHVEHLTAQRLGKEKWYDHYELRVAKVERSYSGPDGR